jgi:hypothetical protein
MGDPLSDAFRKIGDVFNQIGSIFEQIGQIFIQLFQHTTDIGSIFEMILCPINIFTHIHLCAYYWLMDKLFYLIWLIIWWFVYIFIFLPLWLGCLALCTCIGNWMVEMLGYCPSIELNDVCPSKDSFFNGVENLYRFFFNGRFLERDDGDMKTCYCVPALRMLFDPFRNFRSYYSMYEEETKKQDKTSIVFPCFIIFILILSNFSGKMGNMFGEITGKITPM